MIVDCAHYKDGARQHEGPIPLEQAGEVCRARGGAGSSSGSACTSPSAGDLERAAASSSACTSWRSRTPSAMHQRPKIEDYDESWFIVLRTAHYHEDEEEVHFGEIHVFAGPGLRDHRPPRRRAASSSSARTRLEGRPDLLKMGPPRPSGRSSTRSSTTTRPSSTGSTTTSRRSRRTSSTTTSRRRPQRIYHLKREVIEFHRAVYPLLGPLEALERGAFQQIPEELRRYFRDVHDHAQRVDELVNSQRELLTSILEANLALVSVTQNE